VVDVGEDVAPGGGEDAPARLGAAGSRHPGEQLPEERGQPGVAGGGRGADASAGDDEAGQRLGPRRLERPQVDGRGRSRPRAPGRTVRWWGAAGGGAGGGGTRGSARPQPPPPRPTPRGGPPSPRGPAGACAAKLRSQASQSGPTRNALSPPPPSPRSRADASP